MKFNFPFSSISNLYDGTICDTADDVMIYALQNYVRCVLESVKYTDISHHVKQQLSIITSILYGLQILYTQRHQLLLFNDL